MYWEALVTDREALGTNVDVARRPWIWLDVTRPPRRHAQLIILAELLWVWPRRSPMMTTQGPPTAKRSGEATEWTLDRRTNGAKEDAMA